MRKRGKTCTEWGGCHDMVAMCVQRETGDKHATAKRKANYTLPFGRLFHRSGTRELALLLSSLPYLTLGCRKERPTLAGVKG